MRVLLVHPDSREALAIAVQLSGNGLVSELVQDIDEAASRLATMEFDAVLFSINPQDKSQSERLLEFRRRYPNTAFYTQEQFVHFFDLIKLQTSSRRR